MDTSIRDDDPHTLPPIPSSTEHLKDTLPSQSADMNASPPATPLKDPKPKKSNPLNDLIDTERIYVEQLTGIIRKIAAAWSRSNLPPPELDTMFRCIEAVYKADKGLLSKLTEIGTNPSSPKALGDLLMRWIDDLDAPYTNYCNKYCCGFDDWEPVRSNRKLPDVLASFSASSPPTSSEQSIWTLDALFLLPKARLKYYRKLYNRLLKGTAAGRSDHRLLLGALEKLDALLGVLESRHSVTVGLPKDDIPPTVTGLGTEDEVVGMKTQCASDPAPNAKSMMPKISLDTETESKRTSEGSTVISNRVSKDNSPIPLTELENRLSTERTLDIFTMNPKAVRLQILPPHLTFTREARYSQDVLVRFTPKATNTEVVHRRGHLFLLSDLLLICEWMTPQEKAQRDPDGPDLWLCYPPLAGKVLRTSDVEGRPHVLQIAVMKKEFLLVETDSVNTRNILMQHLKECVEFSTSLPPPSKEPPPPVPPLRTQTNGFYTCPSPTGVQNGHINNTVPPVGDPSALRYPGRQESLPPLPQTLPRHEVPVNAMTNLSLGPDAQLQRGAHRTPSLHGSNPIHPQGFPGQPVDYQPRPSSSGAASQTPSYSNPRAAPFPFNHPYPDRPAPSPSPMVQGGPYRPNGLPMRPPSDPPAFYGTVRKSSSMHSLASQYSQRERSASQYSQRERPAFHPPMPNPQADFARNGMSRVGSVSNLQATFSRPLLPSAQMQSRTFSMAGQSFDEPSPPGSPVEPIRRDPGPMTSTLVTKCKVFLQQQHSQWKSLGSGKLNLYNEYRTNVKQLVVESNKTVLISTIVLTDGVERVGKTGVAIELSDKGARTGIIYMLQMRDESSAVGLFNSLLAGSDRSG